MAVHQDVKRQFDAFRQLKRQAANLFRYHQSDLSWLQDQIVHHFTFLYGREAMNLETGKFEFERLLDEGKRDFGGYDALILWGTYPRLGLDERTQWDFYDDFPGGRRGLHTFIDQVHNRGVKVFIPYTPWDQSLALKGKQTHPDDQELARLIQEIDADGVFLDTLSSLDARLQHTVESARPGVAFCSEGRASSASLHSITCSWEQSQSRSWEQGNWTAVPESVHKIDMDRFVFPEHRLLVVNRFATGKDRIRVIHRGFFNGLGWVVWQDVFGLALPYTPEEAALLKKCRTILRSHRSTIWGPHPYPHLPTQAPGVYCNEFTGGGKRIWTFYNDNDDLVDEAIMQIERNQDTHLFDLWNEKEIEWMPPGLLPVRLEPHSVGAVVEFPRILKYSPPDNQVSMANPVPHVMLHFQHSASSSVETAQAGIPCEIPPSMSQGKLLIQLVRDHEVLDQIVIADRSPGDGQKPNAT